VAQVDASRLAQPLPVDPITGKPQSIGVLTKTQKFDCGGGCAFSTAGDYIRFGQMLLNGGQLDGQRVLSPATVTYMTSNHLGANIQNNVAVTEPARQGYGFGLSVAVRTDRGVAAVNGHPGDFFWNGANGTQFWVDPKQNLVVVMMAATPGEIRKVIREQVNALVYAALEN
jgi:CubicO group peptidase (beta-lactamase class C family)